MVDATRAMESKYVNADLVRDSPTRKLVILGEGEFVEGDYGAKLELPVMIDGKDKTWSLNKDSAKNLNAEYGRDSKNWVGAIVKLQIAKVQGKDSVLGVPTGKGNTTPVVNSESI